MNPAERQSIFTRYVTLAGANFLAAVFGFFVAALLARYFGPTGFGQISLATTLVSFAMVITNCGMGLYAVRTVAMGQSSLERMIPAVVSIRLMLSVVVFLGLAACAYSIPKLYESRHLILFFGVTFFSKAMLLMWAPQAIHRTGMVGVGNVMLKFFNLTLLYILLRFSSSLYMAPIAAIGADVIVSIGLMMGIRRYTGKLGPIPGYSEMKAIIRQSAPIGMTQLVRGFTVSSDLIILGLMATYVDVGIYAAAFKLFLFLLTLGGTYFVILLPHLAEISDSDNALFRELRLSFIRVLPILFGVVVIVWLIADLLIRLLFGADYAGAVDVLKILSLAVAANIISRHYRQVLLVKKMQETDLKMSTISAVVHVAAKLMLIPVFGIIGCALGTLTGELALLVTQRAAVRKLTPVDSHV